MLCNGYLITQIREHRQGRGYTNLNKKHNKKYKRHVDKDILTNNNLSIIITQDRPVFVLQICQAI